MAKTFDATLKELVERHPRPWLGLLLGRDVGEVRVVNADLSTITAEADKIFRVEGAQPWIVHIEFQSGYKSETPLKAQRYNILARYRHGLPVQTVVVLLRPDADGPNMTGLLQDQLPDGTTYHVFRYNVVKVWELSPAEILAGDLSILPLAPIARVSEPELPGLVRRMEERIEGAAPAPTEAADLWFAAFLLMGLAYDEKHVKLLLEGVRHMSESTTYQAILREGETAGQVRHARRTLLRLGRQQFGPPDPQIEAAIEAISSLDRLDQLTDQVLKSKNWQELMTEP
jgi:hypothetical protein